VYHQNSFRSTSPDVRDRYFTPDGNGWVARDALRRQVEFRLGNLLEPASYDGVAPVDVLFCRNVLIYFSDVTISRAVRVFHSVLAPGGYLFLGHAESLSRITSTFTPIRFPGAMIYQKPETSAP
jgi:chemotaxis protein methyltransferase CheR